MVNAGIYIAMTDCTALIVAAGRGSRFGSDVPKQYCALGADTVIGATLKAFDRHPGITTIQAVIHADDLELYNKAVAGLSLSGLTRLLDPVYGGASRQESVYLGLQSLAELSPGKVLIHDAARPFISKSVIDRVLAALDHHGAVIPALPVNDTLKRCDDTRITGTVDRSSLVRAQTPQGFRFGDILAAHRQAWERAPDLEMTDDAAIAEFAGLEVIFVDGGEENAKITTQQDLQQAERAISSGEFMTIGTQETRTGTGFDVHRFEAGDSLTLCGVTIPHSATLAGHSDADVGLHALTDALLGAVGEGDIGFYFPPTDPQWQGANSDIFVKKARDLIAGRKGRIINVDITLICENPKIGPYRAAMKDFIAAALEIDPTRVSIKATTTERLGFTGRNEGIAAQAVASIELPNG